MQFIMGLERKCSYKFCMNVVCECVLNCKRGNERHFEVISAKFQVEAINT
jgi:hypothetical protein